MSRGFIDYYRFCVEQYSAMQFSSSRAISSRCQLRGSGLLSIAENITKNDKARHSVVSESVG